MRNIESVRNYVGGMLMLIAVSSAWAAPTVSPSSGTIDPAGQVFEFRENDVDVEFFSFRLGTEPSGENYSDIDATGRLPGQDGGYRTPPLPAGRVYMRFYWMVSGMWQVQSYSFDVSENSTPEGLGAALLAELGCGVNELIRTTATGWECVDANSFEGPAGPPSDITSLWVSYQFGVTNSCSSACGHPTAFSAQDVDGYVCRDNKGRPGRSFSGTNNYFRCVTDEGTSYGLAECHCVFP
ncbi:hypothetical protein N9850_11065 [Granulosicoccus sp.]|nr:hypothetical protein [Granulosicoccus sp.]MDB4224304.1 hypothetical protein [Granulosicoccus sp.]